MSTRKTRFDRYNERVNEEATKKRKKSIESVPKTKVKKVVRISNLKKPSKHELFLESFRKSQEEYGVLRERLMRGGKTYHEFAYESMEKKCNDQLLNHYKSLDTDERCEFLGLINMDERRLLFRGLHDKLNALQFEKRKLKRDGMDADKRDVSAGNTYDLLNQKIAEIRDYHDRLGSECQRVFLCVLKEDEREDVFPEMTKKKNCAADKEKLPKKGTKASGNRGRTEENAPHKYDSDDDIQFLGIFPTRH
ncbi:unnamed protein product [Caenorhabditis auriculariae]|uniref:Uncharacterized protein n=1 Tax=Caenorhabditis auriculariae TaxID=2777116 RepID=A0A8S1HCT3_9PELO|nr:unnamed protein product [Caenorhabditis auriculariae]